MTNEKDPAKFLLAAVAVSGCLMLGYLAMPDMSSGVTRLIHRRGKHKETMDKTRHPSTSKKQNSSPTA